MKIGDLCKLEWEECGMHYFLIGIITGFDKTCCAYLFHNKPNVFPQFSAWSIKRLEIIR